MYLRERKGWPLRAYFKNIFKFILYFREKNGWLLNSLHHPLESHLRKNRFLHVFIFQQLFSILYILYRTIWNHCILCGNIIQSHTLGCHSLKKQLLWQNALKRTRTDIKNSLSRVPYNSLFLTHLHLYLYLFYTIIQPISL